MSQPIATSALTPYEQSVSARDELGVGDKTKVIDTAQSRYDIDRTICVSLERTNDSDDADSDVDSDNGGMIDSVQFNSSSQNGVTCKGDYRTDGPCGSRLSDSHLHDNNQFRRYRTAFTKQQLQKLEEEFIKENYVSRPKRCQLASELNLAESTIKVWFQNRRMKDKRQKVAMAWPYGIPPDHQMYSYLAAATNYQRLAQLSALGMGVPVSPQPLPQPFAYSRSIDSLPFRPEHLFSPFLNFHRPPLDFRTTLSHIPMFSFPGQTPPFHELPTGVGGVKKSTFTTSPTHTIPKPIPSIQTSAFMSPSHLQKPSGAKD